MTVKFARFYVVHWIEMLRYRNLFNYSFLNFVFQNFSINNLRFIVKVRSRTPVSRYRVRYVKNIELLEPILGMRRNDC